MELAIKMKVTLKSQVAHLVGEAIIDSLVFLPCTQGHGDVLEPVPAVIGRRHWTRTGQVVSSSHGHIERQTTVYILRHLDPI